MMSKPRPLQKKVQPKVQVNKQQRKLPVPKNPKTPEQRRKGAPKKPATGSKAGRINWENGRRLYVVGHLQPEAPEDEKLKWYSMKEVALRIGCNLHTIQRRAAKENWAELRQVAERVNQVETDRKLSEKLADQRVKSQVKFFQTGMKLVGKVDGKLNTGDPDAQDLRALASTVKASQEIVETAFGKTAGPAIVINGAWLTFAAPPKEVYDALPVLSSDPVAP